MELSRRRSQIVPVNAQPADLALRAIEQALRQGTFAAAVVSAESFLAANPQHVAATRLLGAALRGSERFVEAAHVLRELAAREPNDALIQNSLGAALRSLGDIDGAQIAFARACELAPDLPPAFYNHAIVLFMQDRLDAGLAAMDRVIELAPANEQARVIRSQMLLDQGRIERVTAEYRAALKQQPDSPWAWFGLSNLKNLPFAAADVDAMQRALDRHRDAGPERTALLFALAKALDDNSRYAESFAILAQANAGVRAQVSWDAEQFSAEVDAMLQAFDAPLQASDIAQGNEVIFIVSPPRSGSTLTEQILASHPQVAGAGERDDLHRVIDEENRRRAMPMTQWAGLATPADWSRLGRRYLELTAHFRKARPRCTDKALANWRFIGAALAMLPQARVVVCRRDPVEIGLSCYRQHFSGNGQPFSYDQTEIAAYWRDFDRACRQWKRQYPQRVTDLVYEELVRDQEAQTRQLLAFCGLDFNPACLRFYATERKIDTVSNSQVREPMRRDTAHAAKYGALLDPLRRALGLPLFAAIG